MRVHLDESSLQNGPLRVLPATHAQGILSDDDIQRLAVQIAPVDCLASQGAVLAMRPPSSRFFEIIIRKFKACTLSTRRL